MARIKLGFLPKPNTDHCDIYILEINDWPIFYKNCGAIVKSAVFKQLKDHCDNLIGYNNEGVVSGVAELKKDGNMKMWCPKMFSDMIWVSSQLVYDAITKASITDGVVVYGLLTNYNAGTATVIKY